MELKSGCEIRFPFEEGISSRSQAACQESVITTSRMMKMYNLCITCLNINEITNNNNFKKKFKRCTSQRNK